MRSMPWARPASGQPRLQNLLVEPGQASLPDVQANEVRHPWRRIREHFDLLFELSVCPGQPRAVLSQMLFPGGDEEDLDQPPRRLALAEESPLCRPCP